MSSLIEIFQKYLEKRFGSSELSASELLYQVMDPEVGLQMITDGTADRTKIDEFKKIHPIFFADLCYLSLLSEAPSSSDLQRPWFFTPSGIQFGKSKTDRLIPYRTEIAKWFSNTFFRTGSSEKYIKTVSQSLCAYKLGRSYAPPEGHNNTDCSIIEFVTKRNVTKLLKDAYSDMFINGQYEVLFTSLGIFTVVNKKINLLPYPKTWQGNFRKGLKRIRSFNSGIDGDNRTKLKDKLCEFCQDVNDVVLKIEGACGAMYWGDLEQDIHRLMKQYKVEFVIRKVAGASYDFKAGTYSNVLHVNIGLTERVLQLFAHAGSLSFISSVLSDSQPLKTNVAVALAKLATRASTSMIRSLAKQDVRIDPRLRSYNTAEEAEVERVSVAAPRVFTNSEGGVYQIKGTTSLYIDEVLSYGLTRDFNQYIPILLLDFATSVYAHLPTPWLLEYGALSIDDVKNQREKLSNMGVPMVQPGALHEISFRYQFTQYHMAILDNRADDARRVMGGFFYSLFQKGLK